MSPQELIAEIQRLKEIVDMPLDGPANTLPGRKARQIRARQSLRSREQEYRDSVLGRMVPVFVTGDAEYVEEFCGLAALERSAVIINTDALYESIASNMLANMDKNRLHTNGTLLSVLMSSLSEHANHFGVPLWDLPADSNKTFNTKEEVVQYVRKQVRASRMGDSLCAQFLVRKLGEEAIDLGLDSDALYCVVLSSDDQELISLTDLLTGGASKIVNAKSSFEKKDVNRVLGQIRHRVEKNKKA